MTVHVVIPVFNRLPMTQSLIESLRAQVADETIKIIVVDDGSTDGSAAWLAQQPDISVLTADGSLFWGGAVDLAMREILKANPPGDWLLLMNNDTEVDPGFVQALLDAARANAPAAVGSVIRDQQDETRILSLGARIDATRIVTRDLAKEAGLASGATTIAVDALSGRGTMFPLASLVAAGGMRPKLLPHYYADYELSLRVRKAGWRLLVATAAAVRSPDEFGSQRRFNSIIERFFSIRSPFFIPALTVFWWQASSWSQRLTLPARLFLFALWPQLRKYRT